MNSLVARPAVPQRVRLSAFASTLFFAVVVLLALAVLSAVAPVFFGLHSFVILSGSMEPTISTGSVALARAVPSETLQQGDIIAFQSHAGAGLPTVHRIIRIQLREGTRYYTNRGDANTGNDAEITLPPEAMQVIGSIPVIGYLIFYAAQPAATLVLVVLPLVLLVLLWARDWLIRARAKQLI